MQMYIESLEVGSKSLLKGIGDLLLEAGSSRKIGWAVFTGSAGPSFKLLEKIGEIKYSDYHYFPQPSVDGHSGVVELFVHPNDKNQVIVVFKGRVHFYESEDIHESVFFSRLAVKMGFEKMIFTNAAGALKPEDAGKIMVINSTGKSDLLNPLLGKAVKLNPPGAPRFVSTTNLLDPDHVGISFSLGASEFTDHFIGVGSYYANPGPDYESKIEVEALRTLEYSAVGMSTAPDLLAAKSMNPKIRLAAFSLLTNACVGFGDKEEEPDHKGVVSVAIEKDPIFSDFVIRFIELADQN
jgi:purine-nucleoside phosphorylase